MNRTLMEKARCLLFEADLDKKFQENTVNTAIFLRNHCVISGSVQKPNNHVNTFRNEVIAHIPNAKRRK